MKTKMMLATAVLTLTSLAAPEVMIAQGPPPQGYGRGSEQGPPPPRPGWHNDNGWQGQEWARGPREFDAVRQRGFQDGMYGARKDVENGRRPTPNNRWEYTRPNVPPYDVQAYRDGFRRGYNVAMSHFMRGGYWR